MIKVTAAAFARLASVSVTAFVRLLILNNVHRMSKVMSDLQHSGRFRIDAKLTAALSPYRTIHHNRYGVYPMDLNAPVEAMNLKIKIL